MPSSTSPSMGLFLPVPGSTPGPQWASETTTNWSTLDTHDHTAGKGVQIPIAALNVNADFSWLTFGQTNVGYLSLTDKLATGNLTVNASLGNVAGDPYWRNASGVVKKISLAGDALTIASGTSLLGSLLMTAIAAPGSPSAGFGSLYFDTTATNIAVKNSSGVVKHGVQTRAVVASNWITGIADDGSTTIAQPTYADLAGTIPSSTLIAAGALGFTRITTPGTPAAGTMKLWADSIAGNFFMSTSSGAPFNHGVLTKTAVASQWITSIADDGTSVLAQPAFADLSGSLAIGQIPNSLITYAKIQNVSATNTFLGRKSAGAGVVEEISNSGTTAGRVEAPVLIQRAAVSAVTSWSPSAFTANAWKELIIRFKGTTAGSIYFAFRVNGDTAAHYSDMGVNNDGSSISTASSAVGGLTYARAWYSKTASIAIQGELHFFPITDGNERTGWCRSGTCGSGAVTTLFQRTAELGWNDKVTDITSVALLSDTGPAFTGTFELLGVPA